MQRPSRGAPERPARRQRARPAHPAAAPAQSAPDLHAGLQALSESAIHITVYDLLAHAYDRVAIQYYHDQGAALLVDQRRFPVPLFAAALPPAFQREVVAALLADSARAMATFFGFEEMNFLLLDHEQQVYRLVAREGLFFPNFQPGMYTQRFGTGLLGTCHLQRCTVLFNDVGAAEHYVRTDAAVRAELAVPVVLGDEVLAIIDSGATQVDVFTPAHAAFIEGFARYLAPAIADPLAFLRAWRPGVARATSELSALAQSLNFLSSWHEEWRLRFAQLYTEVAQRNAELVALIALGESLSSSLRLDTILSTTVAKVAQLLSCEVSWILLPDDGGRLHIRALHGGSAGGLAEAGIAADSSPQFAVFAQGEAVITNDLAAVPRSSFDWAFCRRNDITHYATVPLRVRERTIGVMNVGRTHMAADLHEQDVRLLSTFANQIALAIENADLYERSRLVGAVEERNRLARDLHDTLVQSIVGILRTFDGVDAEAAAAVPTLREAIVQARGLARLSLDEARRSVWNLPPVALDGRALAAALEAYLADWGRRAGVETTFELAGQQLPLAARAEADVLHIAQEALSNIARHAAARHVAVSLVLSDVELCLRISDDGAGFTYGEQVAEGATDGAPLAADGGYGLRGMRERAALLGGQLHIESAPGRGTQLTLTCPLPAATWAQPAAPAPPREPPAYSPTPGRTITVLLADDHPTVREGLRLVVDRAVEMRVVGVAANGQETLEMARGLCPDILLLDVQLPDMDGIAVLRQLRKDGVPTRIAMLSAHAGDAQVAEAIEAGAVGYLQKDIETAALLGAIRTMAKGQPVFSPAVAARLHERVGLLVNVRAGQLTAREREVLRLFASGLGYRATAQRLCVSVATVKFHAMNLYQKLRASSRVEALNRAREWGLLD
jgi:two-component system, NarL family, sensor kinase